MSEQEDDDSLSLEDLLRQKEELENENSGLVNKLQEGQSLKTQLREARKDSKKLTHHREKLKNLKSGRLGNSQHNVDRSRNKKIDDEREVSGRKEATLKKGSDEEKEETHSITAPLIREINALKLENASLVEGKMIAEEQKDALVQELAALNTKQDQLSSICNSLESEINRLSSCVGKSNTQSSEQEEGIEVLKEQLRLYQEDIKTLQAQLQSSQRSNERLKTELNEARLVIRGLRKNPPHVQVYPAAICEPVYRTFDDHERCRYSREPMGYAMIKSYSGDCLAPSCYDNHRRGIGPVKKTFLTPDLTAEVDNDVIDYSLASSKSI